MSSGVLGRKTIADDNEYKRVVAGHWILGSGRLGSSLVSQTQAGMSAVELESVAGNVVSKTVKSVVCSLEASVLSVQPMESVDRVSGTVGGADCVHVQGSVYLVSTAEVRGSVMSVSEQMECRRASKDELVMYAVSGVSEMSVVSGTSCTTTNSRVACDSTSEEFRYVLSVVCDCSASRTCFR